MGVMTAMAIGAGVSAIGGAIQSGKQHKAMRAARGEKAYAGMKVEELQSSRPTVPNPASSVSSLAGLSQDLTDQMSNPFANLGVATRAAEIQFEQTDIALANTLDTMMASGAGAGGATALAQAALKSKQGIAANIEAQEAKNEQYRAQGEQALQAAKVEEQRRLQSIAISEGQREQAAEMEGKMYQFNIEEDRRNSDISYWISKETGGAQREAQARSNRDAAIGGAFTGVGNIIAGGLSGGAFG